MVKDENDGITSFRKRRENHEVNAYCIFTCNCKFGDCFSYVTNTRLLREWALWDNNISGGSD